ncbi:MAG: 3-hydroxyisobutyrate dehydrogenase [Gammaproteobacteria bacterium]|jgi:3-hydroxyisobutyrate dehydrogenase
MKTGVIGLGVMGGAMALNLHKAGLLHRVWNRTSSKANDINNVTGVEISKSIKDLATDCDVIITCVSKDEDLLEVMGEIANGIQTGTIVIDTSTVSSETAKKAATIISVKGGGFLDCPVTGGSEGAKNATLSLMVGGDKLVLENAREVLAAIGKKIVHIGPTGSGQACKAVNQVICAGINQAVTEGLSFGEVMGLDMDRVLEAISAGAAGNWFMDHRGKTMLAGTFDPGFKLKLHHKDLKICLDMASRMNEADLPLTKMTVTDYEVLMDQGYGDEDISTLFRLKSN